MSTTKHLVLTAEQLLENWEKFLGNIDNYITGERGKTLKAFYEEYAERFVALPASHKSDYHNCFAGGYVEHVNRVVDAALSLHGVWKDFGAEDSYTVEELVFAALNHDLGKFGDLEHESVFPNDNDWEIKNRGMLYKFNPDLTFMTVPDRGLWLLSQLGIKVTINEMLGIKLHDGLYDEANKPYYISYIEDRKLKTSLPFVLHQADLLAARVEYENRDKTPSTPTKPKTLTKKEPMKTKALSSVGSDSLKNVMNNFFES
jgi:hypothetical protein